MDRDLHRTLRQAVNRSALSHPGQLPKTIRHLQLARLHGCQILPPQLLVKTVAALPTADCEPFPVNCQYEAESQGLPLDQPRPTRFRKLVERTLNLQASSRSSAPATLDFRIRSFQRLLQLPRQIESRENF